MTARARGASVVRYAHDDPEALERLLRRHPGAPRPVCMDGINSMTGNPPQLPAFLAIAREHDDDQVSAPLAALDRLADAVPLRAAAS